MKPRLLALLAAPLLASCAQLVQKAAQIAAPSKAIPEKSAARPAVEAPKEKPRFVGSRPTVQIEEHPASKQGDASKGGSTGKIVLHVDSEPEKKRSGDKKGGMFNPFSLGDRNKSIGNILKNGPVTGGKDPAVRNRREETHKKESRSGGAGEGGKKAGEEKPVRDGEMDARASERRLEAERKRAERAAEHERYEAEKAARNGGHPIKKGSLDRVQPGTKIDKSRGGADWTRRFLP